MAVVQNLIFWILKAKKCNNVIITKDIICSIQYVAGTHMFLCGGSVAVLSLWVCVNFALSHIQERF